MNSPKSLAMSLQCKPLLIDRSGTPLCIPKAFWKELFSGGKPFPLYANKTVDTALAFIADRPGKPLRFTGAQCIRIYFNEEGFPVKWHMSTVRLETPYPLGSSSFPNPAPEKFSNNPLFWFPRKDELKAMAKALEVPHSLSPIKGGRPVVEAKASPMPPLVQPQPQEARLSGN